MQRKSYFFTADFSDVATYLQKQTVDTVFEGNEASALASVLQDHDQRSSKRQLWAADGKGGPYDVMGAYVAYNGPNDPFKPTNSKYDHVLILKFDDPDADGDDRLYLQYNLTDQG